MSGSIGANRIEHSAVKDTVDWFKENILKAYPSYKSLKLSGSAIRPGKKDHGDIDIVVCVEEDNLRDAKKSFERYLSKCTQLLPFRSGKNKGKKVQVYGNTITCQIPIQGFEGLSVQVDCNLALSEKEQEFTSKFLDLSGEKQCLLSGLVRVALLEEDPERVFKKLHINNIPKLEQNQELEFVLSERGLILRKVTYEDGKEVDRENIWISRDWSNVSKLLSTYDLDEDFYKLLDQVDEQVKTSRARKRIVGTIKANVNVSAGEKNTAKEDEKERAIKIASEKLENLDEEIKDPKDVVALYAGGFKPPHKAHYIDAQKLYNKADRLIIFIGSKVRSGIPVTAEQSEKIWNIYASYLKKPGKPIEVRVSKESPLQDVFAIVSNPDNKNYTFLVGKSENDKDRYKELKQYSNVEIVNLSTVSTKEDEKLSATTLRHSIDILKAGKWLPGVLDRDDTKKVLDILIKPLEQEVLREEIEKKTEEYLNSLLENSTGTPIAPSSVLSSENREKLGKFYEKLEAQYGTEFYIKFNQTFILIKCPDQERLADLYTELNTKYQTEFNFKNVRDAIQIKPKYKSDWMSFNTDDGSGTYRDNSGNGGFDYMQDQAEYWLNEEENEKQILRDSEKEVLDKEADSRKDSKDLSTYLASYLAWIHQNKGVDLENLPEILLNPGGQNLNCPMKDKSGEYDSANNKIIIYGDDRTLKEKCRSFSHEIAHWIQNKEGKLKDITGNKIKDDKHLKEIELEANNQSYAWFREWTESLEESKKPKTVSQFIDTYFKVKKNKGSYSYVYRDKPSIVFTSFEEGKVPKILKFFEKHKITRIVGEQLGFSEAEQKWYGWARGIYGFGIGSKVKKGDCAYTGKEWTAKSLEDAKQMAKDYAKNLS